MRVTCASKALLAVGLATLGSIAACAQTDVAASIYGAFHGSANGLSPSNTAGVLVEGRHIVNPLVGYELTYAYNRADQSQATTLALPCPLGDPTCGNVSVSVPANAHQITGDWVASLKIANIRPFALAGGGVLFDVPAAGTVVVTTGSTTSTASTSTSTKGVFVYGAGLDWGLVPHIGLRLQYRGNVYKLSSLVNGFTSTSSFTQTAEPMLGVYFRL
jgi:opacity protein-like surface antigen